MQISGGRSAQDVQMARGAGSPGGRRYRSALRLGLACCVLALLAGLGTAWAGTQPRVLRVVTDDNYPPYLFLNSAGQPEGYLVDLWKLWQARTGVRVDLEPMQWAAAQRAMHEGKADVIDMLYRTPVRDQLYTFSKPYSTQKVGIYVDHNIHGVTGPRSLQGFTIGVERGDACIDKLGSLGITRLSTFPNYMAILRAAKAGTIKMFCMDDDPAHYYLYLLRDQLRFSKAFTLYEGHFHWAVNRGDNATFALVRRGMAMITPAERAALRRKWFRRPIQFQSYLRAFLIGAAGALAILAIAGAWIGMLRKAVRLRTAEISDKNRELQLRSRELAAEHAQLLALMENTPDAMWLKDPQGVYVLCNGAAAHLIGLPREQIVGHTDAQIHGDASLIMLVESGDRQVMQTGALYRAEETVRGRDDVARDLEVIKVPIRAPDGEVLGVLGVGRDISERRRAERELQLAAVAFESQDGMIVTDAQGIIERVNTAFTRMTGYAPDEVIGKSPAMLRSGHHARDFYVRMRAELSARGVWRGEIVDRRRNAELFTARVSIASVKDAQGRLLHYVGTFQDVTLEHQARQEAEHLKLFDPLTNLPNRTLLDDRIAHAQAASAESQQYGTILMVDLDDFQRVNDAYGHKLGDELLVEVGRRIQWAVREGDTVGRFSGDSFVVVVEDLGEERIQAVTRTMETAETIRNAIREPIRLQGRGLVCTASVGATVFLGSAAQYGVLLRKAELAMYKCKQRGGNMARMFEDEMQAEVEARARLESELREAIEQQQFVLHYQPQVDSEARVIGAEVLLRWQHPQRGLVGPATFIPLAEDTGLIEDIGRWVLAQACRQLAAWSGRQAMQGLSLSVNVSTRQIRSPGFVDEVLAELRRSGARADRLKLEITERVAVEDFEVSVHRLQALRDAGVLLSVDDFGTGNSSLSYLTRLPLNQLKIDKSFVDHLPGSHSAAMVAQAIIAMGRGLGLHVIAEGVETREQRDFLAAHGCHAYQGYWFGRPVALDEFERKVGAHAQWLAAP